MHPPGRQSRHLIGCLFIECGHVVLVFCLIFVKWCQIVFASLSMLRISLTYVCSNVIFLLQYTCIPSSVKLNNFDMMVLLNVSV